MANHFNGPVSKIVDNYLDRLRKHLKGFPAKDQEELVKEIHSHIYESFRQDPTENEVERILKVLDKLGEPADVVSTRMSTAMVTMGKKKKLPFYILAGTLIALFGVPLGLGGIAVLFGLFLSVLALIASYYIVAAGFVISGWLGALALVIKLIFPDFLSPYWEIYPLISDPTANIAVQIFVSLLVAALGIGLIFLGKYMMRGLKFVFALILDKIHKPIKRRFASPAKSAGTE